MQDTSRIVTIVYTNYRKETEVRRIIPKEKAFYFGSNQWHTEPQWLLEGFDLDKQAERTFAIKDIRAWF